MRCIAYGWRGARLLKSRSLAGELSLNHRLRWIALLCVPLLAMSGPSSAETKAQREFNQVIASKPDAARGQELFAKCAVCHGSDGGGMPDGWVPRIAGQHYRVLASQILDFRSGRRWDVRMEGVATSHEVMPEIQDIADVAWYVSQLDRDGKRGIRDGQYVERGAAMYAANCRVMPWRRWRWQRREADSAARRATCRIPGAADLRRGGWARPPLAKSHGKRFASLGFEEVLGLTDYLARLGWQQHGNCALGA